MEYGICTYLDFICPEDENAPCHYQSDLLWSSYDDHFKPIIDTCTVEEVNEQKCKTKRCTSNSDCFSEHCYKNVCVTPTTLYKCVHAKFSPDYQFECRKANNMKCSLEEDCLSFYCKNGFCKNRPYEKELSLLGQIFRSVVQLVLSILGMYAIFNFGLIFLGKFKEPEQERNEKNSLL